jgi:hypothetical protein
VARACASAALPCGTPHTVGVAAGPASPEPPAPPEPLELALAAVSLPTPGGPHPSPPEPFPPPAPPAPEVLVVVVVRGLVGAATAHAAIQSAVTPHTAAPHRFVRVIKGQSITVNAVESKLPRSALS